MASRHHFALYIVGGRPASARADSDLRTVLDACVSGDYEIEVIDLLRHPSRAEKDGIFAAPTVVRHAPSPQQRVVGDLSDAAAVRVALGLPSGGPGTV